ncbi:MAG TPA: hypothetical protein VNO79_11915 [Actinomycetota bacterium]|nr:hypothetical protein [Actinomycetota bacterium]
MTGISFEEFASRNAAMPQDHALALYAYSGGRIRPAIDDDLVWQRAIRIADLEAGRVLELSERDRARAEAASLGLPWDESGPLAPRELPTAPDDLPPSAVSAAVAELSGDNPREAYEGTSVEETLAGIEEATAERERWERAARALRGWYGAPT